MCNSEFQRYVIRKLTDIGFKVSSFEEQVKVLHEKVDSILYQFNTFPHRRSEEREIEPNNIMDRFPIDNLEDLQVLETSLTNDGIFRRNLVSTLRKIKIMDYTEIRRYLYRFYILVFWQIKELSRIGGNNIKAMTFNLLRKLMSDKVACLFSYVGGKKKRIFYDLQLRKIVFSK